MTFKFTSVKPRKSSLVNLFSSNTSNRRRCSVGLTLNRNCSSSHFGFNVCTHEKEFEERKKEVSKFSKKKVNPIH